MSFGFSIIAFLLLLVSSAAAQSSNNAQSDTEPLFDCELQAGEAAFQYCGDIALEKAEREMDRLYSLVLQAYQKSDKETKESRFYNGEQRHEFGLDRLYVDIILDEQKAWLNFRKFKCELAAANDAIGGSMYVATKYACLVDETDKRSAEFREFVGEPVLNNESEEKTDVKEDPQ